MTKKVLVIVGPTGSGKTALSLRAAHELNGEVVSADSMQVYRGMDIGTAKLPERDRQGVAHHMIDVADPDEPFSVAEYQKQARKCLKDILARDRVPIVCGGSGLYVNSLTHALDFRERSGPSEDLRQKLQSVPSDECYALLKSTDPEAAERIHPNNRVRVVRALEIVLSGQGTPKEYDFDRQSIEYDFLICGISPDRTELRHRIDERIDEMLAGGLLEEVWRLKEQYPDSEVLRRAIGYKELLDVRTSGEAAAGVERIRQATKQFAKRQMTWFRRDPRIVWFGAGDDEMLDHLCGAFVSGGTVSA